MNKAGFRTATCKENGTEAAEPRFFPLASVIKRGGRRLKDDVNLTVPKGVGVGEAAGHGATGAVRQGAYYPALLRSIRRVKSVRGLIRLSRVLNVGPMGPIRRLWPLKQLKATGRALPVALEV
jgi:hypothetical protein